jgi:HSF-type DNA-binding
MSSGGKRMPNGMMNHQMNSTIPPQRKVSLEHGYGRNHGGMQSSMSNMNIHPMHMHDMMMMDYGMMGMGPDPYDMGPHFMPMHPAEAAAMGPMMEHMMDFPPPRFMSPMQRRLNRPPRNVMLPELRGSIEDFESEHSHSSHPRALPVTSTALGPPMMTNSAMMNSAGKRKERAPSSTSFPTKLYKILSDPQYQEYIVWLPHGRAWRVLKPKALEEDVIPKFFRSDRYASFMRQVR